MKNPCINNMCIYTTSEKSFALKEIICAKGCKFFPLREDTFSNELLTLLLLKATCPVLANNVDPDQLASEEAN